MNGTRSMFWEDLRKTFAPGNILRAANKIYERCNTDDGFKRACIAAAVADMFAVLACPFIGILMLIAGIVYIMPCKNANVPH